MIVCNEARLTINNSSISSHADFQDQAECDATRVVFSSGIDFRYFVALNGSAFMRGHDLIMDPNSSTLAVQDNARVILNVLSDKNHKMLEVECDNKNNINIIGIPWEVKTNN